MRTLIALLIVTALAGAASADIALSIVDVDNSEQLTGYVTNSLVFDTDSDWLSAQMIITLDAPGAVYQDGLGNTNPQSPNPAFFPIAATLEFDSYVANGVLGESVSVTGAVDLGGPAGEVFDADHISILWYTTGTEDIGSLELARITLADTATGSWDLVATAQPQDGPKVTILGGTVVDGVMDIPEPATMALLGLGGLLSVRRRRR